MWIFKWRKEWKRRRYYGGTLYFEGEYLYNYKLKGKYYLNNHLEYEGEYLYNKIEKDMMKMVILYIN